MNKRKKKSKKAVRLNTDDIMKGVVESEVISENDYLLKHKKRLGIAPCKQVVIRWK